MPNTTTIAAGSSASISLAAGASLSLTGYGTAQIAPPAPPGHSADIRQLTPTETRLGPYVVSVTINVVASAAVIYYITQASDVLASNGAQAIVAPQATALASGTNRQRTSPLRVATFGDSTANVTTSTSNTDVSSYTTTFATHAALAVQGEKWQLPSFYPQAYLVANGGISGQTTTQMLARDTAASSATRKSIQDVIDLRPDVILLRAGSINDLTSVTAGTVAATVASTYANHVAIINRFLSAGIVVVDEGLYAYSGSSAPDPASTRLAVTQLNAMYAAYAATLPGRVYYQSWVGILSDSAGNFLPGVTLNDGNGIHLSIYGQYLSAQAEGALLAQIFGASSNQRYQGTNLMKNAATSSAGGNSLMAATGSQAYGTVPTGFSWTVSNGTRQNAKVEIINGKVFATCEVVPTNTACYLQPGMPLDSANWAPAANEVYGVEFDWFVSGLNGAATPAFTNFLARWDFTSTNNIPLDLCAITQSFSFPVTGGVQGHFVSQPFIMGSDTAALSLAELIFKVQSDDQVGWKIGVGNPRLVKLGTTSTWPPVAP